MTDATAEFFEEIGRRGHEPLLQGVVGTLRFDVKDGRRVEYWFVTVDDGDLTVARENAPADAVIVADRALSDGMASGKVNPTAAFLRGLGEVHGDLGLVIAFQRLFPGPPRRRAAARRTAS